MLPDVRDLLEVELREVLDACRISYPSAYAWSRPYSMPLCTIFT